MEYENISTQIYKILLIKELNDRLKIYNLFNHDLLINIFNMDKADIIFELIL